jgi:hypothetical protein
MARGEPMSRDEDFKQTHYQGFGIVESMKAEDLNLGII